MVVQTFTAQAMPGTAWVGTGTIPGVDLCPWTFIKFLHDNLPFF